MSGPARFLRWSALLAIAWGCQPAAVDEAAEESDPAAAGTVALARVPAEAYRRAERFLPDRQERYVLNASITPHWIGAGDRFWYKRTVVGGGGQFVTVTVATGEREPSFDHALVARELSRLDEDGEHTPTTLPFDAFTFNDDGGIDFAAGDDHYRCTAEACTASEPSAPPFTPLETPSPDGKWAAYHQDHDLWVRSADGETRVQLTTDGEEAWHYGGQLGTSVSYISMQHLQGGHAPQVKWSPDSTKLLTQRVDERGVGELSIIEHVPADGSRRPRTHTMRYAFARDAVKPRGRFVVFDIPSGERADIDYPDIELTYAAITGPDSGEVWWREDTRGFGFVHRKPFARGFSIHRVDLETGEISVEFERVSERTSSPGIATPLPPQVVDFADGSIVWFSDESGYGHLYRKDADGNVAQITSGDWNVGAIVHVDREAGRLYFLGSQAEADGNPYHHFIYGVDVDGSDFARITPSPGDHGSVTALVGAASSFSPGGGHLVVSWSTTTDSGRTELLTNEGELVAVLETADPSPLEADGFVPPEPFTVTAADGETTLYGALFFPADFDPERSYPLIDSIYPGPQIWREPHQFAGSLFSRFGSQSMAELGFVVMTVDGRGTPGRSRDFHFPPGVNLLGAAGSLDDHVAAIEQLAAERPYIDTERVGIYGWSGGGYASTHAILSYPDFYKVAVSGAGNHDPRTYLPIWGESYQGDTDDAFYEAGSNAHLAGNLKGKLFLVHGALDDNVHPGNTYAVVDALIKANKDFDLLILPNAAHAPGDATGYFLRRQWDYFVTHLLGMRPPEGYEVGAD